MYKSVFAKYITAFMLIIALSFSILAVIIGSMILHYNVDTTQDMLDRSAQSVKAYVEELCVGDDEEGFRDRIRAGGDGLMADVLSLARLNVDSMIFLTSRSGDVLASVGSGIEQVSEGSVGEAMLDSLVRDGSLSISGTLDELLPVKCIVSAYPLYIEHGQQLGGAVFVCASSESASELVLVMIKTMIMALLWVMLAALIAVYFITEKIIGPLKDMSKAAKDFAAGHLDVRVPVVGQDEVAELATAFNNMAQSLSNLEDMRRSFLANVSHDLRTPMTTIRGFIDGILSGAIPPDQQEHYLKFIAAEVMRLSNLVSTLLDLSRIQAGDKKFNMQPFDICEMARQILLSFEQKIDAKKLDVSFDCDSDKMVVMADHQEIYRLLYNLCDNAVKFSAEGGKYELSLHEKDKKVLVSVFDEGQGIAPEDLPYVFDRFYKGDKSRGMDKTGTGLGLYIAKTIIEAHGEKIWVESEYGKNCRFSFTLKATDEAPVKFSDND